MKRPASVIAPAFVAGICVANFIAINPVLIMVGLIITCIVTFLCENKWVVMGFIILALLLGIFRMQQQTGFDHRGELQDFYGGHSTDMLIEGLVLDIRSVNANNTRYEVLLSNMTDSRKQMAIRIPVILSVRDYEGMGNVIEPGGRIVMNNHQLTHDLRYQQQEPYLQHWRSQGFKAVLETKATHIHSPAVDGVIRHAAYQFRKHSERIIDGLLPEPENSVLKSLFFGSQGYLPPSLRDLFTQTGTAHLIAVSGLHVGILTLSAQFVLEKLGSGKFLSRGLTILMVWFYAAMAGYPVSIIRAATMYTLFVMAFYGRRHYDAKSVLLWSGMGFLWFNPLSLFTVSFQLSFAAVASLLWLYPRILHKVKGGNNPIVKLLLVTFSVQLGTWPVIVWHFGTFSVVSLPANLLVVPLIALIMPMALIMVMASVLFNHLAKMIALFVLGGLRYMLLVITWFHQWPISEIQINYSTHVIWYLLYYMALFLAAIKCKKNPVYTMKQA